MSRIKKSISKSQSTRMNEIPQVAIGDDYSQNIRETPYKNPPVLNQKSKYHSESKNLLPKFVVKRDDAGGLNGLEDSEIYKKPSLSSILQFKSERKNRRPVCL
jgi:hypothetical protein